MSFTRKIIDGLLEKVATDETPLSHVDEQELEAELAARVKARGDSPAKPADNPRSKHAGASAASVKYRDQQAAKRAARVKAKRTRQRAAQEKASEEAFRRAQQASRRAASSSRPSSGSSRRSASSGSAGGQRRRAAPRRGKPNIGDHYKTLNLPPTASLTEAKRAFRKLMRKYHPDLAPDNKKKAATELTMRITGAYNAIEEYHSGK